MLFFEDKEDVLKDSFRKLDFMGVNIYAGVAVSTNDDLDFDPVSAVVATGYTVQ